MTERKTPKVLGFQCDDELHQRFRVRAAKENMTIRQLLIEAADDVLDKYERRELASRKAGTGGNRAAREIQKLTPDQKSKMAREAEEFEKEFDQNNH